ncbi:MAG: HEAT repeat domain-containing protein, partial [Gemmatales bacterium]|nr:HEAT repeat domain-containing protein [Gemmatales bacterium]
MTAPYPSQVSGSVMCRVRSNLGVGVSTGWMGLILGGLLAAEVSLWAQVERPTAPTTGEARPVSAEELHRALRHSDWRIRWLATQHLAQKGSEGRFALGALARTMRTDASAEVRAGAIIALARIGGPARFLVPELVEYTHRPAPVGAAALWALGQLATPEDYDLVLPVLRQALSRAHAPIRLAATVALGDLGPAAQEAVPELLLTAASSPSLQTPA